MKKYLLSSLLALVTISVHAQDYESKWYAGIGGGMHFGSMSFSKLDKEVFPKTEGLSSGLFSVFVERNFGQEGNFGLRPQLSFLHRGGKVTGIYSKFEDRNYYNQEGISDIYYKLNASYVDLRLPVFYQFGTYSSKLRPYIFVAPVIGFPTGGKINVEETRTSGAYSGYELDLNNANMAGTYVAGAIGAGVKMMLNMGSSHFYIGLEASYEKGLSDTYGSKEKEGKAIVQNYLFYNAYDIKGTRDFSGFELMATIGIPLGAEKHTESMVYVIPQVQPEPEPEPVIEEPVVEEPVMAETPVEEPVVVTPPVEKPVEKKPVYINPVVVREENPCYTIEEISDMINEGKDVRGLTFCSIDDIQFEYGKSTIMISSYPYLNQLVKILRKTNMRIEIKGHTDNMGSKERNMQLSRERARSVINYLVKRGVNRLNLTYSFYGMSKPLGNNSTEEGRRMNRRVEFEILK